MKKYFYKEYWNIDEIEKSFVFVKNDVNEKMSDSLNIDVCVKMFDSKKKKDDLFSVMNDDLEKMSDLLNADDIENEYVFVKNDDFEKVSDTPNIDDYEKKFDFESEFISEKNDDFENNSDFETLMKSRSDLFL